MRVLTVSVLLLAVSGMGWPEGTAAQDGGTKPSPERGPPTGPMDYSEALRQWDGTGELLLLPQADVANAPAASLGSRSAIGATFDNSDAPKPEVDPARSAFGRCVSAIFPARLIGGDMVITAPLGDPWRKGPRIGSSDATGRTGVAVQYDRCRYTLDLHVKVPGVDGWVSSVRYIPPPPPPFTGKSIVLKPGETMTFKVPPTPAELSLYTASTRFGPYVPPDLAARCPRLSGSLWFTPQGVFVDMPWGEGNVVVPGIRREPSTKVTTLIFQKPECRLELSVRREIQDDAGWHSSPLSPIPTNAAD